MHHHNSDIAFCAHLRSNAVRRASSPRNQPAPVIWVRLPWHRRAAPGARAYAVSLVFAGNPVIIRGLDAALLDVFLDCDELVAVQADIFSDEEISRIVRRTP